MTARTRAYLALMAGAVGRLQVVALFGAQLLVAVTEAAGLALLAPVLQSLGGGRRIALPGLQGRLPVGVAFTLVLVVMALRAVAFWTAAVLSTRILLVTVDSLRLRLVGHLYAAEWRYLAGQRRSHVVQRLTGEVDRAQQALTTLVNLVVSSLILAATVAVAVLLAPLLGTITACLLAGFALVARRTMRTSVRLGRSVTEQSATVSAVITDSLSSIRLMRAHEAAGAWLRLLADEAQRTRAVRLTFARRTSAFVAAVGVVVVAAVLGLILAGRATGVPFGSLAALAVIAVRILGAAQGIVGSAQVFAHDAPALDRLTEFIHEAEQHRERSAPAAPGRTVRDDAGQDVLVSLRDVTLRYRPGDAPALRGVSLDVARRGLVTVTGASGAGKSTLLDVLLGLLVPDEGAVLVDGAPLVDVAAWRARIGYVPQQTVLVPGTVRDNLTWSLPAGAAVSDDEVRAVLSAVALDGVVGRLPDGLDTHLQDFTQLSGGEQQRLSIARALLRRPDLLLLDEATSALDTTTEQRVLEHLIDGTRAVVLVTHRVSALAAARTDVDVVLAGGERVDARATAAT